MSGLLNSLVPGGASALLPPDFQNLLPFSLAFDWRGRLLPASFRGVPFEVFSHDLAGGRRGVVHEFVGKERPVTEDLGKAVERYVIDAFVIGDDYDRRRDDLKAAVFDTPGPGTLVHPYLGQLTVQVMQGCGLRETLAQGGMAWFRIVCADAGISPFVRADVDGASSLIGKALAVMKALRAGYSLFVAVKAAGPAILYDALAGGLADLGAAILGTSAGSLGSIVLAVSDFGAAITNNDITGAFVSGTFQAAADGIVAAPPTGGDPSGGLAALTGWAGAQFPLNPTATPTRAVQQVNAQALTNLAQGCAAAALAQIYAQTTFLSAQAAEAARSQLLAAIDAQSDNAALLGDDASYDAWQDLGAAASAFLTQEALSLPQQGRYAVGASLPSVVLAYRLYQDANRADAVEQWNSAVHPLFMPAEGVYLTPSA